MNFDSRHSGTIIEIITDRKKKKIIIEDSWPRAGLAGLAQLDSSGEDWM